MIRTEKELRELIKKQNEMLKQMNENLKKKPQPSQS
jgi:hypothetical protein